MVAQDDKFRVLRKLPEVRFEEELRGYSKSQVDRVLQGLAPLANDVAALQQRLADAEARAAAAEARLVEARATSRPVAQPAPAVAEPVASPPSFDETLSKTLLLAQRTADHTVAEAKAEAERLVGDARAEAEHLKSENARARREAEAGVEAERQALLAAAHADVQAKVAAAEASLADAEGAQREALVAEIADYTALRDELGRDIERLEGHLAQRREVIRAALADIALVVDDPARLHSEMPPAVEAPVSIPAAATGSVVLAVEGIDDLAPEPSVEVDVIALHESVTDTGREPGGSPSASATYFGELATSSDLPTQAVPMVELFADPTTSHALDDRVTADAADGTSSFGDDPSVSATDDTDDADRYLDDWGTTTASLTSGAVIIDEVRWDDAPAVGASPADFGFEDAADHVPSTPARRDDTAEELSRPAWAESVPDIDPPQTLTKSDDPFLDELRRATGDDAETDVALERFLTDNPDDDERRSGWFSRRK